MFFYPELDIYFKEKYKGDKGLIRNYHDDVKNFVLIVEQKGVNTKITKNKSKKVPDVKRLTWKSKNNG